MNLEEMINHLYFAESILKHIAEIATPDSPTGDTYNNAAETIGDLIVDLERLDSALKLRQEADQPKPATTDKGFTLPPYSFRPNDTGSMKPPYIVGDIRTRRSP